MPPAMRAALCRLLLPAALLLGAPPAPAAGPELAGVEFFEKRIRPVLVEYCYKCHSGQAKSVKGGLRLDSRDGLLKGGDTGPALVPGKPKQSLLLRAVRHAGDAPHMPPKGRLPPAAVADLEKWIVLGAPDPRTAAPAPPPPRGGFPPAGVPAPKRWLVRAPPAPPPPPPARPPCARAAPRRHWAFQPLKCPPVPAVKQAAWPRTPVDNFILTKLEEQ